MAKRLRLVSLLVTLALFTSACTHIHVLFLAGDALNGRDNNTPGSVMAQDWIIDYLQWLGIPAASDGTTNQASYLESITNGANVVGAITGSDLSGEIVVVGAHYDHIASCDVQGGDTICNGATDNAAGVGIVLEIARALAQDPTPPRRTVVFAFWDREEDGLLGSAQWIAGFPFVANIVSYVNYDIQGANLLPSLRNETLAVAAESGGTILSDAVAAAGGGSTLDLSQLSGIFGQGRSDYQNFLNNSVPTVFFTDATGPCYHTTLDDYDVVDIDKLAEQTAIGIDLVTDLASMNTPPSFVGGLPAATYDDAVVIDTLLDLGVADIARFTAAQQAQLLAIQSAIDAIVAAGAGAFDSGDIATLLINSATLVNILSTGACDGFLAP